MPTFSIGLNICYSVLYCIYSTLLGGELSGFCFVVHSLKGAAARRQSMVRAGPNVKPITKSLHLPFMLFYFISLLRLGITSIIIVILKAGRPDIVIGSQGWCVWVRCHTWTCMLHYHSYFLSLTFAHSLSTGQSSCLKIFLFPLCSCCACMVT